MCNGAKGCCCFSQLHIRRVMMGVQALRQLEALEQQRPAAASGSLRVTVVGAGYAGIELATTLAERIGSRGFVQIIHGGAVSPYPFAHVPCCSSLKMAGSGSVAGSRCGCQLASTAQASDRKQLGFASGRILCSLGLDELWPTPSKALPGVDAAVQHSLLCMFQMWDSGCAIHGH